MSLHATSAQSSPVILNLFQDPSRGKRGAFLSGAMGAGMLATSCFGRGVKWVLKQVQDDENGNGLA